MEDKIIYMPCDTVEAFMRDAFVAAGVPAEDAALCANVLISADKRGIDSHGVGRLCSFYLDRIRDGVQQAVTQVEFVRKSGATAVVDGHAGMAMVVAKKSMEYAMECAKSTASASSPSATRRTSGARDTTPTSPPRKV